MIDCRRCGKHHRSITEVECADRSMTEHQLQSRVLYRAKKYGWKVAHAGRGIIEREDGTKTVTTPMSVGWPDLMCFKVGHNPPVVAMELKREVGDLQPEQVDWLLLMNECGIPAILVRPSDLREGRVTAILT